MALTFTKLSGEEKRHFGRHVLRVYSITHDGSATGISAGSVGLDSINWAIATPGIIVLSATSTVGTDLTAMSAGGITFTAMSSGATFNLMVEGAND